MAEYTAGDMTMSLSHPAVFVCSATGSQGGAIAHMLSNLDWTVHATTRNIEAPEAMALKEAGVHLTQGDWDDSAALTAGIAGCDRLFLCLLPDFADMSRELRQAKKILEIAKYAGVTQVVVSTSLGVSQLNGLGATAGSFTKKHLTSKKSIEQAVRDLGFEHWTSLRPGFFMANFIEPKIRRYPEIRDTHSWKTSMTSETLLPLVDHMDIAKIAVAAFQRPEEFHGRAIGIASELLRVESALRQLGEAVGRPNLFKAIFMTDEEIQQQAGSNVLVNSQKAMMRTAADFVDLAELAQITPLTTFKEFLERERTALKQTYH